MSSRQDLGALVRAIIDANRYMTLGTADEDGRPWVSPVFYAAAGYTEFYWMSSPEVTHSRNLARRPQVSIVVFDSQAPPGTGEAVYLSATARELDGADLERGVEAYPGPAERGGRVVTLEELRPPTASTGRPCRSTRSSARGIPARAPSTGTPSTTASR